MVTQDTTSEYSKIPRSGGLLFENVHQYKQGFLNMSTIVTQEPVKINWTFPFLKYFIFSPGV